jgi:small neutral amino acid transporter SnatA (MarC family)
LFGIALNMMRLRRVREIQTPEEVQEGITQDDIALVPLAVPRDAVAPV